MIFRSVVGKLWMTIIGMVAVVLSILSFSMFQLFDRSLTEQRFDDMEVIAQKAAIIIESQRGSEPALSTIGELIEEYSRIFVTIDSRQLQIGSDEYDLVPEIDPHLLINHPRLVNVYDGQVTSVRDVFTVRGGEGDADKLHDTEMMIVAVPLEMDAGKTGALFLYQSLEQLNATSNEAKKIILYAAAIGFVMTTVFAFFLSTRITQPLLEMKTAADRFARGEFKSQIEIRTRDEIGDLALTFNRLADQLDALVTALSHEKEHLYSILRSMADGVATFDADGNMILANPPAQKLIQSWYFENGRKADLKDYSRIDHSEIPEPFQTLFNAVVKSESEVVTDIIVQGRTWSVIMDSLYDQNGVRGTVAVMRDMTEERRLDKLRQDFVANVSHELRTPISLLQGYSEALVDGVVDNDKEIREIGKIIHDESLRMGRLVNELLDLAKMESGRVELNIKYADMSAFLQKMYRKFAALAKERNLRFELNVNLQSSGYPFDEDRMEQVLTNLIDNAIRHSEAGGRVRISAEEQENDIFIRVEDNGSGIPKEDLPFVFERFYKANKARTRGEGGTGLGLAIAKNIVNAHKGLISVNSNPGKGATFTVQLPRNRK